MSTATVNGDTALKGSGSGPKTQQQQAKSNSSGKTMDGVRKQAGSPVDGQNKKQTSQPLKAWQGPNPITQRASNQSGQQNGTEKPLPKLPPQTQQKGASDAHSDKHAHDRLLYLLAHCTGIDATLTLKSGEQFTGVFGGSSFENPSKSTYILKMVKRTKLPSSQVNGHAELPDEYIGEGEDHVMSFDVQDTTDLAVSNVVTASAPTTQNGSAVSSFRTDTEISHRNTGMPRQRELQKWDGGLDMSLDDMALEAPGSSGWDQFAANEEKFGTQTTYDENEYTTSIDRSHPDYNRRMAEAARLAREIETSAASNAHVAEERHQNADRGDGLDEEEKYSGVRRDAPQLARGGAGSYVPPSRRPITSAPTVPGAPFDPAIISLAKPIPQPAAPLTAAPPSSAQETVPPAQTAPDTALPVTNNSATTNKEVVPAQVSPLVQASAATKKTENTTEDHVRGTADAFKQFANNEKLRIRQAQEQKRSSARHEKMARLTDLKRFAENFKLKSRVPDDLVPILAKDHDKQLEIKRKAETTAREEELRVKEKEKATPSPQKQTSTAITTEQRPPLSLQQTRTRPQQPSRGPQSGMVSPQGRAPAQRQTQIPPFAHTRPQPQPLPLNTGVPTAQTEIISPTGSNRLNVNAKEFKFQPAANNFTPSGASPSPRRTSEGLPQRTSIRFLNTMPESAAGLGDADVDFDIVKELRDVDYPAEQKKGLINGLPQPFRTLPTWPVEKGNENKSYGDVFPKRNVPSQGPSPLPTPNPVGGAMPHAHQLPPHMQGPPNMQSPSQPPRFYPHQQINGQNVHPPNFDVRMQYPGGPNGSVQNSPRYNHAQMAYGGGHMSQMQMPPMPQFPGQPMPGFGMSPAMPYRQMQAPPQGQMMMMPGQPQQNMNPMRPGFQHNSSFQQQGMPPMGGHPMAQSHSNSGFMPNGMQQPQPPFGSPMHGGHHMNQQPNGYANSPRPGPQMMQHSGSQQGFQPNMQQQMPYGASPSQPPYQQQRHPSGGNFPQMTPRQQQAMPAQGVQHVPSPGMGGHGQNQGDEGK